MRYSAPLTRAQAVQLGEDVGMILAVAANALNHIYGTDLDNLMRTFTSSASVEATAARYLQALEEDLSPGDAAARAATALVLDWADAVHAARSRLKVQGSATADEEAAQ